MNQIKNSSVPITPPIAGRRFFCSWSGGKDSSLALYHAIKSGGRPECLLTMMSEDPDVSRSHGLPRALLEQQARQLGIPIVFVSTSWNDYEANFIDALRKFRRQGIEVGVFGDIDVESNRDWCVRVCQRADIEPFHPLWQRPRRQLLDELIALRFKATIVVTNAGKLGAEWLGRQLSQDAIHELEQAGVDACGEMGEYHTVVTAGPIFCSEIHLTQQAPIQHQGYWFMRVATQ